MVRIAAIGILLLTTVAIAQIRLDVDLVLINATVVDGQSRYVQGLRPEHFQVFEDKIEQKIEYFSTEDQPISVGIILDASGSMKESISAARDAAAVTTFSAEAGTMRSSGPWEARTSPSRARTASRPTRAPAQGGEASAARRASPGSPATAGGTRRISESSRARRATRRAMGLEIPRPGAPVPPTS